ncbi:MAG TPA: S41 family peptidase [Chryseosolibacter sp.]
MKTLSFQLLTIVSLTCIPHVLQAQKVETRKTGQKVFVVDGQASLFDTLSAEAKVYGLSTFWKDASYNFVFFDRLKVNWDSAYYATIPKVLAAKNMFEYWRVLDDFAKLLNDGHTGIYRPDYFWKDMGNPPVMTTKINDRRYVTRIDQTLLEEIPIGSEVLKIDNKSYDEYIKLHGTLVGYKGTTINYTFRRPDGTEITKTLTRYAGKDRSVKYVPALAPWRDFSVSDKNGYAYVKVNTFELDSVAVKFRKHIPMINRSKALILDIRDNGGGNTSHAISLAQHLTNKSVMTGSSWRTRIHKAANKAWASWDSEEGNTNENLNYLLGNEWEIHPGQKIKIARNIDKVTVPIIILIGERTFSAAEDFLILLDGSSNIKLIGQNTGGSSGQPLYLNLVGGLAARICSKRDTYPDGRDFIGIGIKPDVYVKRNEIDYLKGVDTELEFALHYLSVSKH